MLLLDTVNVLLLKLLCEFAFLSLLSFCAAGRGVSGMGFVEFKSSEIQKRVRER